MHTSGRDRYAGHLSAQSVCKTIERSALGMRSRSLRCLFCTPHRDLGAGSPTPKPYFVRKLLDPVRARTEGAALGEVFAVRVQRSSGMSGTKTRSCRGGVRV